MRQIFGVKGKMSQKKYVPKTNLKQPFVTNFCSKYQWDDQKRPRTKQKRHLLLAQPLTNILQNILPLWHPKINQITIWHCCAAPKIIQMKNSQSPWFITSGSQTLSPNHWASTKNPKKSYEIPSSIIASYCSYFLLFKMLL